MSYKDTFPNDLKSFPVYTFTCASCISSYIGKTYRHFKSRIEEHIKKHKRSHIFKHLHYTATCFDSHNSISFKIIDKAYCKFDLKIKEALHTNCRKPNLNVQQNLLFLFLFFGFVFPFLLHLLFSLSLTLTIDIFCCISFISLLHLIATHLCTNTPITSFSFTYCFHYLYANYRHLLLSLITLRHYFISL